MITTKEMARIEKLSEEHGVPPLRLMENAGFGLAKEIENRYNLGEASRKVLFVCYHGNNGGDGFVAARYLARLPKTKVHVAFLGDTGKLKDEAETNFERLHPDILVSFDHIKLDTYDIIVDALLGTGAKGELRDPIASAVRVMNASGSHIVAVDVPTGLDPDTGEKAESCIDAELVVSFHDIKKGLVEAGLEEKTVIVDIGVPKGALQAVE